MSVHISSLVWRESKATGAALLVLVSLADQANDDGECWPKIDSIAARCRVSRSSVTRHLKTLVELGELEINDRHAKGTSSEYRVILGQGPSRQSDVRSTGPNGPEPQVNLTRGSGHPCSEAHVTGDLGLTSTVTRQEPSLEPSLEPSRESAGAPEPTSPPRRFPARCRSHQDAPAEGPCGPCGDARRTHEQQTADDQVAKARQARADRAEKTRLRRADIHRCTRCDQRGYLPSGQLCVHDLADTYAAAASTGAAAARAQLATTTGARP